MSIRNSTPGFRISILLIIFFTICIPTTSSQRLGAIFRNKSKKSNVTKNFLASEELQVFYYDQILDHFGYGQESNILFRQRYLVNYTSWSGSDSTSPIFVYLGAQSALEEVVGGILEDNAAKFGALIVYIEHRYYGESVPFASRDEACRNTSTLGYLNTAQALVDYALVIVDVKNTYSAEKSPVIVFGSSYGGMLAAWFRLKYPHIAFGALASSAPILAFDDVTPKDDYYSIISKDFKETSEFCYNTIRDSWSIIDKIAHQNNGLIYLGKKFKACQPISSSLVLKDVLKEFYADAAQYSDVKPFANSVNIICNAINDNTTRRDTLSRIVAGMEAIIGEMPCYDIKEYNFKEDLEWNWQTCTELITPVGVRNNTMFQVSPFNLERITKQCQIAFGVNVTSGRHWIAREFGGHDIHHTLNNFGSNIIFSNGLRDPSSGAGILHNMSDSIIAVYANEGSHSQDMAAASANDSEWLVRMRASEFSIIRNWLEEYKKK